MKNNKLKYTLSLIFLFCAFNLLNAQNIGEYIYPFKNQKLKNFEVSNNVNTIKNELLEEYSTYQNIDFILINQNESLGSKNYTFQILYSNIPLDQAWVKIHIDKKNNKILLIQSNIPNQEIWNNFYLEDNNTINENKVVLIQDEEIYIATKKQVEIEKTDTYVQQFQLPDGKFYENSLKYHTDTTAHVKVFLPDPLTTANQVYGGNYQDAYIKDTSALLIQSFANNNQNTITSSATTFTYEGQNFNINAASYINNFSSPTIHQVFENIYLDGQGIVLGYNATITDNLSTFTSQIIQEDYNYPELAAQQVWQTMPVDFVSGEFKLQNDYFIISEFSDPITNETSSPTDSFNFNRSQIQFEDANTFFHLNNYKKHWESLGFTDLADQFILIDAHGNNGADNSFFTPTTPPKLIFGQGGVDDAEDADVIIHEYGHALSHFASPNSNIDSERRALDEGFGDYIATSYSLQYSNHNWFNMFSWDGHNEFWIGRLTNSPKTGLDINTNQNIYYNAEIWSSTLMDLYFIIGGENTDKLAIEAMYYNMPNTTLTQAALNLFVADTAIFSGQFSCDIFDVLEARKFISGTCQNYISDIKDYNTNKGGALLLNSENFTFGNDNLIIEIKENNFKQANYQIIDLKGTVLLENTFNTPQKELKNLNLSAGIYFIRIETNNNLYSFKILKN